MKNLMTMTAAIGAAMLAVPASAQVMTPAEYVMAAGAGDLYEITSSQAVLQTTQNPQVRDFAQMMVMHHTKSTAQVKAAAMKSRVRVTPPKLNPLQQELVTELRSETGTARDAAYIAQQKAAHGQALAVQMAYAQGGTSAPLRMAASGIVPVVKDHIKMLMMM